MSDAAADRSRRMEKCSRNVVDSIIFRGCRDLRRFCLM